MRFDPHPAHRRPPPKPIGRREIRDTYTYDHDDVEQLLREALLARHFVGGQPGENQRLEMNFEPSDMGATLYAFVVTDEDIPGPTGE